MTLRPCPSIQADVPASGTPPDSDGDRHERSRALAKSNAISVNTLMDELATIALADHDVRVRFETRKARGRSARALSLLGIGAWVGVGGSVVSASSVIPQDRRSR